MLRSVKATDYTNMGDAPTNIILSTAPVDPVPRFPDRHTDGFRMDGPFIYEDQIEKTKRNVRKYLLYL